MKTRQLFVGAAALLAIVAVFWFLPGGGQPAPPREAPATETAEATPRFESAEASHSTETEREVLDASGLSAAPTGENQLFEAGAPVRVEPWLARFLVVDERDAPVAGALVKVSSARRIARDSGFAEQFSGRGTIYSDRPERTIAELRTDAAGRAQSLLDLEFALAEAHATGRGSSRMLQLRKVVAVADETKLRIEPESTLRGIALHADGTPASGASIKATVNGVMVIDGKSVRAAQPEPATTGADGRFTLTVQRHSAYALQVEHGVLSRTLSLRVGEQSPPEVTLVLPGMVHGLVVDADGKPVAHAEVRAACDAEDVADLGPAHLGYHRSLGSIAYVDADNISARTGDDGRFPIQLLPRVRYQLTARKAGHADSSPLEVAITSGQHPEVRLVLLKLATIRGHVERGDGSPFAGIDVGAQPESSGGPAAASPPKVGTVTTAADGTFELAVHRGWTWTVFARPRSDNRLLQVQRRGVWPGSDDVVLRISDADLAGCVVHGTVARADGQPCGAYEVWLVDSRDGKPKSRLPGDANFDGPRFTLPPLALGEQYGVIVEAPRNGPLAPAYAGLFWTDRGEVHLEFCLQPWGTVPVRVVDAAGGPVRGVSVNTDAAVSLGTKYVWEQVDHEGRRVLTRAPGSHTLGVHDGKRSVCEREILVTPGPNSEVVVQLPAAK